MISLNAAGLEALDGADPDLAAALGEAALLDGQIADRSPWSRADHLERAKLLFLALFKSAFEHLPEARRLLGDGPFDVHVFDRVWVAVPFYAPESLEAVEARLPGEAVRALGRSASPVVNRWLSDLKQRFPGEPGEG
ncbi:MAG: hypothetical protein QM767_19100 [Anaeromyxobacter sp.]